MNEIDYYDDEDTDFEQKQEIGRKYEPMWLEYYHKRFPDFIKQEKVKETKNFAQDNGIDRIIYRTGNTKTFIEEKIIDNVYPHIAFEWLSNSVTGAPGWIEKDLLCHYLAYAFGPIKTVYFFNWQALRNVWIKYGEMWKKSNGCVQIRKRTISKTTGYSYYTFCCAVPIYIVEQVYQEALIKLCIEPISMRLIDDKTYMEILDEIERKKNKTSEEKRKQVAERIKQIKNK